MIACYDLARCPPTYDVVAFLVGAEMERLRRGDEHIDLLVLPGPAGGFRRDGLWPSDLGARVELRDKLLLPLCRLLPSARSVTLCGDRKGVEGWGKDQYTVGLREIVKALKAGCKPLRPDMKGPGRHPFVTFTLREAQHHPIRNSHVDEWCLAAEEIAGPDLDVIILRDTRVAEVELYAGDHPNVYQAMGSPKDLALRAALYGEAVLNVGVSNGPMWMSLFMDAPTLMMRPTTNEAGGCFDNRFFTRNGLTPGRQLPGDPLHQRLEWETDTCRNIVEAVQGMLP